MPRGVGKELFISLVNQGPRLTEASSQHKFPQSPDPGTGPQQSFHSLLAFLPNSETHDFSSHFSQVGYHLPRRESTGNTVQSIEVGREEFISIMN